MTVTIKGLNSLTNKLNKLDNIKAKNAVKEVAEIVEKGLKDEAGKFSDRANLIGEVDAREYLNGNFYVDVGLKSDTQPWEEWKHLYFHHYGYNQKLWGKDSDIFTTKHQFWFNKAVDNIDQKSLKALREKIREEIRKALK